MPLIQARPFLPPSSLPVSTRVLYRVGSANGEGIDVDAAKNYYIAGGGGGDGRIIKYDVNNNLVWQREIGTGNIEGAGGVAVTPAGDVFVAGLQITGEISGQDTWAAKYDTNGNIQWKRVFGTTNNQDGFGIATDGTDCFVCGRDQSASSLMVVKLNGSTGVIIWEQIFDGASTEDARGIAVDSSGDVYVVGDTGSHGVVIDQLVLKLNGSTGAKVYHATIGHASLIDYGRGIDVDSSGNAYFTGKWGISGDEMSAVKLDSSGNLAWRRQLASVQADHGWGAAVDASGNAYFCGQTNNAGAGNLNVLVVKYDTSGTLLWKRVWSGSGNEDVATDIATDGGNYYLTGKSNSTGYGTKDMLVIRMPGDGSGLGVYGGLTYADPGATVVSSDPGASFVHALNPSGLTLSSTSFTEQASAMVDSPGTLTDTAL